MHRSNAMMALKIEFPELTVKQFVACTAYALTGNINQICAITGASAEATKKQLQRSKEALELETLESLRSVFLMRTLFTVLGRCGDISQ
ncbi:hypothetical protein [Yersinia pseudotuberculosis]|uniref:hypothetical protein n=1 Tax=Yersinia pseudotuberculosis TaxID=633 RepID=UPI001F23BE23|nr:hypothetical protein [Yersinia pseudotuberculosis]MCF1165451.1 hypothetical protein [Yersinia pseudotuberculosis]